MPSRVVHVRLDDWALIGCHDILKTGGKLVDSISMSTMVRQIVNALVRNMQVNNKIPMYTKEERYDRLEELYQADVLELDTILDPAAILNLEDPVQDSEILDIVKEAVRKIESEGEPQKISQKVTISEVTDTILGKDEQSINLMKQKCTPFSVFKKKAPKDRLIEWAIDQNNDIIKQAVAILYTGLPQELWGSDKAEEMVAGLLHNHRDD